MVRGGETHPNLPNSKGLVVGNYCHDVLIRDNTKIAETLGGAASFVSNILDGLSIQCDYISRVGSDFAYTVPHLPITNPDSKRKTTLFKAYFSSIPDRDGNRDRILKRENGCDPILPSDIPDEQFQFGLAVGVAAEISPETLQRMIDLCRIVFVDIQALIRVFDPVDGTVKHVNLKESGFFHLLPKIGFLKASSEEAPFVDVEEVRKWCCVVVTDGKDGCRVYWKDGEMQISPFPTTQVDPTGAGDSFLGALVAGLNWGLTVPDAALLGNFFGSLTVGQIGLPKFQLWLLQRVKDELLKRKEVRGGQCELTTLGSEFRKSADHEDLQASLAMAANKLRASHHNNSDQNSDEHVVKGKGMPDNCNNGEQNTDEHVLKGKIMHNNCNKGEHKLLVNGLNEEPVHSIEDQT